MRSQGHETMLAQIAADELGAPLESIHVVAGDTRRIGYGVGTFASRSAVVAGNAHFVGIEIHIGRNRIVRRIFEHLGYEVVALDRVQYAGLTKKDLPRGKWDQEVLG